MNNKFLLIGAGILFAILFCGFVSAQNIQSDEIVNTTGDFNVIEVDSEQDLCEVDSHNSVSNEEINHYKDNGKSAVKKMMEKYGIKFHLGQGIKEMHVDEEDQVVCTLADGTEIKAEIGLVAVGRSINVKGLGLEELGIEQGPKGVILINEKMQTNIPNIYAVGDITMGPQLSHKAQKQGLTAADNICGIESRINMNVIPSATFIQPEVATVGLTDAEAQEKGYQTLVAKKAFSSNEKALSMRETNGFIKVVADKNTHKILGAIVFGPQGSVLIEELSLALEMGLKLEDIALSIHAHPTLSELVMETCKLALGLAFDK